MPQSSWVARAEKYVSRGSTAKTDENPEIRCAAKHERGKSTVKTDETPTRPDVLSVLSVRPPCVARGCDDPTAEGDIVYCALHRVRADDGSLLLRCVFDGGHAPVAPHDPIACADHRRQIDATVMPWEARSNPQPAHSGTTTEAA